MPRTPKRSARERILKHALTEFSRVGYSGARVDRIASRAQLSKGIIYYHFKDKDELFSAVLELAWNHGHILAEAPDDPAESILFWSEFYHRNAEWSRLLAWEGLEWRKKTVLCERERRAFWTAAVEKKRANSGPGGWPRFFNLQQYTISLIAMEIAPILLPHLCRVITGKDAESSAFREERAKFLRSFARFIAGKKPLRAVALKA
jgi:AcrR family transcriptional regulator